MHHRLRGWVYAALLAPALAACGDSGSTSDGGNASTGGQSAGGSGASSVVGGAGVGGVGGTGGSGVADGGNAGNTGGLGGQANEAGGGSGGGSVALDPLSCPVGPADGCCPVAVQYGGSDPDCPSLGCATFTSSSDIPLDDGTEEGGGGVGMVWTGTELVLAWSTIDKSQPQPKRTLHFERRDGSGALTFGPLEQPDTFTTVPTWHTSAELGLHPETGQLLFVSDTATNRYGVLLDQNGQLGASLALGATCNGIMAAHRVYPAPGQFLVAQYEQPCNGGSLHAPRVDLVGLDGAQLGARLGDYAVQIGMTYKPVTSEVLFTAGGGVISARTFAPPSTWSPISQLAVTDTDETAIAGDGTRYGVVFGAYSFDGSNLVSTPYFGIYDPVAGTYATTANISPGPKHLMVPPRLLWTGDGYVAIESVFKTNGGGLPDSWSTFETWIWSLSADGAVRESFRLGEGVPAYLVNAVLAGGRIAITWVTPEQQGERHYLRFLECSM
ncbi:MAG: hypothetical protein U0271_27575 [Polyangiaceae bacterium]